MIITEHYVKEGILTKKNIRDKFEDIRFRFWGHCDAQLYFCQISEDLLVGR